jgi:hypothetical protein
MSRIKGLGDAVEAVTRATGVKAVVDKVSEVTGVECGCKRRKEALNKMVPFGGDDDVQSDQA